MKLLKATIHKYKCVESQQVFTVEPDVTVLVGMNESGKTSLLEALAKVDYFEDDDDFEFDMTHDFPRKQKKAVERTGEIPDAVTLEYSVPDFLAKQIRDDILLDYRIESFTYTKTYSNEGRFSIPSVSVRDFVTKKLPALGIEGDDYIERFSSVRTKDEFDAAVTQLKSNGESAECLTKIGELKKYFANEWGWDNPIDEYIARVYIKPNMPKFMYYDDYYMLPSRISLDKIHRGAVTESSEKTAKALLEIAELDIGKILEADSYEDFKAELEATQAIISQELFKYWSTNKNLRIMFDIDKVEQTDNQRNRRIVDHVLDIRVENLRSMVSLPLANRSKGFNWFFSFLVWFEKIQKNAATKYILLLDEPGLNLHAMAQRDLLKFIEYLASKYQVIYTTHLPFMIESDKLHRVRTLIEKDDGTHVSDCLQEKDPSTLFPMQAALGYTIAQNLFISERNLLVEGIADLVYLGVMSNHLKACGRVGLKESVTIVPVGGADKVATFISLLRGNDLNVVCLLDTFTDRSARARLDNMIAQKLIKEKKIVFYHDILGTAYADVEDLFSDSDYLTLYNGAFGTRITAKDIDEKKPIVEQLSQLTGNKSFNHFAPASYFAQNVRGLTISDETMKNYETLFTMINKLF